MLLGWAGWAFAHQTGSNLDVQDCAAMSPLVALLIGLIGLSSAGAGIFLSSRIYRRGEAGVGTRRFISLLSMLVASLFALALVWQTISSLIIPRCYG